MKALFGTLVAAALAFSLTPAEAATHHRHVHHVHVAHYHHRHHYYAGDAEYYYAPPPGYYPPPGAYAPGYFYVAPYEYLGNRNTFKALIDSEWDPPFSGR